ncbi:MAG: SRPBCC domain-containing protein, partial [Planctomycetales bacterium]|nr:SRPBCC domain-containing protein [Planctomycetales bacterium]
EAMRQFIKQAGGNATWDRLAEYLDETAKGKDTFVINRSFAAPIEQVFALWTDPQHLARWLPPTGFQMEIRRGDIREGGSCFFQMSNQSDVSFFGVFEYREVRRPHRIVYVQRFCDETESVAVHPGFPVFPAELLTTIDFVSEGDDATRVTVVTEPMGVVASDEAAAFRDERGGMTQGWTGSFDRLETEINNVSESVVPHSN